MYWREKPVVGVEDAKLPQFTINKYETNERKIKLATGNTYLYTNCVGNLKTAFRNLPTVVIVV
jgi:hypothetical protein